MDLLSTITFSIRSWISQGEGRNKTTQNLTSFTGPSHAETTPDGPPHFQLTLGPMWTEVTPLCTKCCHWWPFPQVHLEKNRNQEANPDIATLTVREEKKIRSHKNISVNCTLFTRKLLLLQAISLEEEGLKPYQEKCKKTAAADKRTRRFLLKTPSTPRNQSSVYSCRTIHAHIWQLGGGQFQKQPGVLKMPFFVAFTH